MTLPIMLVSIQMSRCLCFFQCEHLDVFCLVRYSLMHVCLSGFRDHIPPSFWLSPSPSNFVDLMFIRYICILKWCTFCSFVHV